MAIDPKLYPGGSQPYNADDIETSPANTKLVEVLTPNSNTRKLVTIANLATSLGASEATTAEMNTLHDVVAGTTSASKALVVDATKNLDTLSLTELKLGAAGGTAVTATAAEINKLAGVTGGTITASKALVTDSNKDLASFRNVTGTGRATFATLTLTGLPTSDPVVTGQLWSDSGTLKISLSGA